MSPGLSFSRRSSFASSVTSFGLVGLVQAVVGRVLALPAVHAKVVVFETTLFHLDERTAELDSINLHRSDAIRSGQRCGRSSESRC